jgi:cytochrome d ubiquinol oxidase subunit II
LIGVALGDLLHGLPVNRAQEYTGSFWTLLQPYGLLAGVTLVVLCLVHGAIFAALKTTFDLRARAARAAKLLGPVAVLLLAGLMVWTRSLAGHGLVPAPIGIVAVLAMAAATTLIAVDRDGWAFLATTVAIALTIISFFSEMYPSVMVSSTSPAFSLTIGNTASGPYTLKVMTIVVVIFLPVVLAYTAWTYFVFRRRLSDGDFRPPMLRSPAAPAGAAAPVLASGQSRPVPTGSGRHRRSRHG